MTVNVHNCSTVVKIKESGKIHQNLPLASTPQMTLPTYIKHPELFEKQAARDSEGNEQDGRR